MKLLIVFMFTCLLIGTIYERRRPKSYLLPVIAIGIALAIGYYLFPQS